MTYERQFFQYLENLKRRMDAKPLNLGGVSSSGGGVGGPPGGFLGQLPQSKITYDKLEAATAYTPSSGTSLLDNLNHIRHQIATISGGGGAIAIQENDVEVVGTATIINFEGGVSVADEGGGKVTVTVTASGGGGASTFLELTDTPSSYSGKAGYSAVVNGTEDGLDFIVVSGSNSGTYYVQEDLTPQVPDGSDNFDLQFTPISGTTVVHFNGLTQQYDNYTLNADVLHTKWSPIAGDELYVEYYYGNPTEGVINPNITVISGSSSYSGISTLNILGMKVLNDGGGQVTISGGTGSGTAGAVTFLDLTDSPSSYTGQAGKVPAVNIGETGLEFTTISGSSPTPDFTWWNPDAPPASPSSYDDEFDDSSFDTGLWTDFDEIGGADALAYSENEYGLTWTNHSTSNYVQGICQEAPSSSGWSIMTKISVIYKQHDDAKCGLFLMEDFNTPSTSDLIYFVAIVGGGGTGVGVEKWNQYNSYLGNIASITDDKWTNTFYLRIRADSSNYWHYDWSSDGIGWLNKDDWFANGANETRLWAPTGFGVCIRANTESPKWIVHWFRYSTDTGYDVVYGDRVNGYRA